MFMMVLCAVILLILPPQATPTESRQETTAETQTPTETKPEQTKATQPESTRTTGAEAVPGIVAQVERILEGKTNGQTAVTRWTVAAGVNREEEARGDGKQSMTYALAQIAQDRKMNPVAAFWLLVSDGAYDKNKLSAPFSLSSIKTPRQEAKQYAYTGDGACQMITDLLALAAEMSDGLELERAILGENQAVEADQVFHSKTDGCRYAYFSVSSDWSTHILSVYLRGDKQGEWIDDVEFQLLSMRHASGEKKALEQIDKSFGQQAAVLMAAAELLMTGDSKAAAGQIPAGYGIGAWDAAVERFSFTAEGEWGTLTNYRLQS